MLVLKIILGFVGVLVAAALVFFVANYAPEKPVDELKARWAKPPSQFVAIQGMQAHVRDEGPRDDPQPIVFMHGMGSSLHAWEDWVRLLKDKRRVITMDLPGYGLTGPAPDRNYGRDRDVAFVIAILDALSVKRAVWGGNSLGAGVSVAAALSHPDRVAKLILVDGGYPLFGGRSDPIGLRILETPGINALLRNTLPRFMIVSGMRAAWGDPNKITDENIDRAYELTQREGNRQAIIDRFGQRQRGASPSRLGEIKVPTLVMWGKKDGLIPVEAAHKLHAAIPGSQLVIFDELGHAPEEEDPAGTIGAVQKFLAE
ncbi:2-hydroxy-6-oxononadienedioate/2-hydroxy-6-oxononatrienedioate hydrolase [Variibacter gotjawalensis]|uniref:2-hydroxy-6-oxononadienedioate/2-hydroxy-6-oxononatrienedioate hydrolase n=1 Tax=Variibacter gotjawalensis TaxID=1333996 RepID=A0A0S3PPT1_9BRAD|nr:alpha/beta hydrolase [Variibacter gotjawalensis]NIK48199.1 pimeloyl-ACP methyl ester carboxylesterase [Variibacter gotjawalensis]RZS50070.1 pimeloyl-ACP methyl ester carboxylesterase [Variibacter gotjawalensis]BAT57901.1 2-hydroxy-6-oxononadienedioate/2-hydroxy-6-oxononatrienedioate hydrolase [Variibacter gotjawalensis]